MRLHRALLPPLLALGLTMCSAGTTDPMCACPPATTTAVLYGRVTMATGEPAAARYVDVQVFRGPCAPTLGDALNFGQRRVLTDGDGRYRAQARSAYAPATGCGEAAVLQGTDTLARARANVALHLAAPDDSVRLDLVLP
jgi:hypothetical protein